jgi:UDP-galactopyranose mutase
MYYDYLIVGSGLYGCTFANLAKKDKKKCLIIEKRKHPFGNCYTENISGINVHTYGPHIFHTSNKKIWHYVNEFVQFNNYVNRPKVNYKGKIYSFPINLFTLSQMWGVSTPHEAQEKLEKIKISINNPKNLEEWILSQVGEEIYYTFIYGYTKKQWNTDPKNLPASIIKRLPIRLNFDDNYFNDIYQGIPIGGYSRMMNNMIDNIDIILDTDYFTYRDYWNSQAKYIIYTGPIDRFYNYRYGKLEYRSLKFEHENMSINDFQGNAVINYTDESVPFTRIVEHKHFDKSDASGTIVTREFPANFEETNEPFYPINTEKNTSMYNKYRELSKLDNKFIFGGRLAQYQYLDMHQIIGASMNKYEDINK